MLARVLADFADAAGAADAVHDFGDDGAYALFAVVEDGFEVFFVVADGFETFAEGCEVFVHFFEECLFGVTVTVAASAVVFVHFGEFFGGCEELVEGEDVAGCGVFGVFHGGGIGLHGHDLFAELFGGQKRFDDVVVGLGHLAAVGAGDCGDVVADAGFGQFEEVAAEGRVEFAGHVAGHFEVLHLVAADGDDVGVVDEDVGGHEHGVGEDAVVDFFFDALVFGGFVGVRALEQAHVGYAAQDPG